MAATKRAQILMEPEEYSRLEELARQRRVSVAALIRDAVRQRYFFGHQERRAAVDTICSLNLAVESWELVEAEIAAAHDCTLP